jgi:transposase
VLYNAVNHEWEKPELIEGLLWRRHVYNSAVESLRKIFAEEINQKKQVGLATENLREQELEELNMRIAENEKRNEKAAEERFV